MQYTINQLTLSSDPIILERMIPILIGKSKTLISENPNFINNEKTLIQLNNDKTLIIDSDTIKPNITYWKALTSEISINNLSSSTIDISLNIATVEKFNKNTLFIVYDTDTSILFSSTIENFIYNTDHLIKIKLTNPLVVTGNLKCKLINKVTEIIPYTYDNILKQVQLEFVNQFTSISLDPILSYSTIDYYTTLNSCVLTILKDITDTDIQNEANQHMSLCLKNTKSAIVVSIPDDTYINEALDKISSYRVGYYIVPLELSNNSLQSISEFCKISDQNFYGALIPSTLITTNTILSNVVHTNA